MSGNSEEDDTIMTGQTQQTIALARRIPILAKFSPKMSNGVRFLALQYTPTWVNNMWLNDVHMWYAYDMHPSQFPFYNTLLIEWSVLQL